MANSSPVPGTEDIFPEEARRYRALEDCAAEIFSRYGYGELRTPTFEYTEVFQRGLGGDTEVVQKEMYTFEDRGGRSLTLRPEGTAGVMRALLNTGVMNAVEQRVFYSGSMFRGERPAAGRRREFHQIGVENVGRCAPELDAEAIAMLAHFLRAAGIDGFEIRLNTRGVMADRVSSEAALKQYFARHVDGMCDDCRNRLEKNIWRILDCKQESCRRIIADAPDYLQYFSAESRGYFERVCECLTELGIAFVRDPLLVRGLDYYVHTVFELSHPGLGAAIAIAGGGRYELFLPGEKRPVCGVGFAAGVERLLMVLELLKAPPPPDRTKLFSFISLGEAARKANWKLVGAARAAGMHAAMEVEDKSMKSQMRTADRLGAAAVIIRGDVELERGVALVKRLDDGSQAEVAEQELLKYLEDMDKC